MLKGRPNITLAVGEEYSYQSKTQIHNKRFRIHVLLLIYLFGILRRFQHCTGHITLEGQRKPVHRVR